MADSRAPTGLARRGRRLPEEETERRMLGAALAVVRKTGLTVSLEHISFEDVIRVADVSRSSAYRRWPHKDLFFSDLVLELAGNPTPGIFADEMDLIRRIVAGRLDELADPQARRALVIELFRQLPVLDFETLYASPGWRTYLALHATFLNLADGGLRSQVQAALAQAEQDHLARVARAWKLMAHLLGFRLRAGGRRHVRHARRAGQRHHAGPGHDGPDRARHRRAPHDRPAVRTPEPGECRPPHCLAPSPARPSNPIRTSAGTAAAPPPSARRLQRQT